MIRNIIFSIGLLTIIHPVFSQTAQQPADTGRPEIGLVLSGGAAKGIAHVGVLKVLEEVGIRPDYITGTSMGAIVGGLYSIGYSADELEELGRTIDWDKILTDQVPLNKIVMEEKEDFERYLLEFPIRNYEFKLPSGLTEGYQLERLFADLTWGATGYENFDTLPIPFHCMSVDIVEGGPVEFDSGHLATTLRASMAIPGVFAPVRIDSMMLVDGGVIRNLPVQEVIDMGADIVIAVYVGFDSEVTPEDLFSLSEVLTRTTIFLGVIDSKKQMQLADILILPNMKGISATDFFNSDTIIARGENAALLLKEQLQHLADSLNRTFEPVDRLTGPDFIYINQVDVEGLRFVKKSFVIGQGMIFPGTYTNKNRIDEAVERLYGSRYFRKVGYRLEHVEGMKYKLIYMTKESTRAFIKIAPQYNNQLGTGIALNGTFRNYLIPSSRIKLTTNIAENPGVRFSIHKYLGKEQNVMAHQFIWWNRNKLPVFFEGENVGSFTHGFFQAGLGAKFSLNFNQQLGLQFLYEHNSAKPGGAVRNFYPEADFENYIFGGLALKSSYHVNTMNDLFFATRGTKLDIELKRVMQPLSSYRIEGSADIAQDILRLDLKPFNTFYFNYDHYFPLGELFSMNLGTSIGLTSKQTPVTNHFALGGIFYTDKFNYETFYGLNFGEQIVPNFWKVNGEFNVRVTPRIFLTAAGNIALTGNKIDTFFESIDNTPWNDYLKGYAAGVRLNTFLGPILLMAGDMSSDIRTRWYISLGYTF